MIFLLSKGLSSIFSSTTVQKHQFFGAQPSLWSDSHLTTGKIIALPIQTFVSKVMSLLFNMLSGLVITFLPWASLVAQRLKRLPGMQETQVQSLGREDPLEKEMATNSSFLAWKIPWMEEPGGLQSTGRRVGHD